MPNTETIADRVRRHFAWVRDVLSALEDASEMTIRGGVPLACGAVLDSFERDGLTYDDVLPMLRTEAEGRVIEAAMAYEVAWMARIEASELQKPVAHEREDAAAEALHDAARALVSR